MKARAAVVPILHRTSAVPSAVRRSTLRRSTRVLLCRSSERLLHLLRHELVDAIVVDVRTYGTDLAARLSQSHPAVPLFAMAAFRPDDGALIAECKRAGFTGLLVEGVDDAVAGEFIAARSASRLRRLQLAGAPRRLRLTEPLQTSAWEEALARVGRPTRTSEIAQELRVTREHLSREFAAGGAPNLKRVIDLVRVAWAADLLRNPGYDVHTVAEILQYSSASHLAGSARRVAGVSPADLGGLGTRGVLQRFVRGRMRSRL